MPSPRAASHTTKPKKIINVTLECAHLMYKATINLTSSLPTSSSSSKFKRWKLFQYTDKSSSPTAHKGNANSWNLNNLKAATLYTQRFHYSPFKAFSYFYHTKQS